MNVPGSSAFTVELFTRGSSGRRSTGRSPSACRRLGWVRSIPVGRSRSPVIPVIVVTRGRRTVATGRIAWRSCSVFRWVVTRTRLETSWWRRSSSGAVLFIPGGRATGRRWIITVFPRRRWRTSEIARRWRVVIPISWIPRGIARVLISTVRRVIAGWRRGIIPSRPYTVNERSLMSVTRRPRDE